MADDTWPRNSDINRSARLDDVLQHHGIYPRMVLPSLTDETVTVRLDRADTDRLTEILRSTDPMR